MTTKTFFCSVLMLILTACSTEMADISPSQSETSAPRNGTISMEQAKKRLVAIVSEINAQIPDQVNRISGIASTDTRQINGVAYDARMQPITRSGDEGNADIYVFRLENDMFAIMSATTDRPELLAIGNGSPNFEDPEATMPNPDYWKPNVPIDTAPQIATPDSSRAIVKRRLTPTYITHQNGGLCIVIWGNHSPYSDSLPLIKNTYGKFVRPGAGCSAVALAQLMTIDNLRGAYYKDHTFDWETLSVYRDKSYFTDNPIVSREIAILFKDLNNPYNLNPSWGVNTSYASTYDILKTLLNFHLSYSNLHNYDFDKVKSELDKNYPVLLSAVGTDGEDPKRKGRFWLCHGLLEVKTPVLVYSVSVHAGDKDILIDQYVETAWYLQMNWGWDGQSDGYYLTRYDDYLNNLEGPDIPEHNTTVTNGYNIYDPNTIQMITGIRRY